MPSQAAHVVPTEEFESVKKQPTNSCIIEDEDFEEEEEIAPSQHSMCCRIFLYLSMFLILGWFIGTVFVAGLGLIYQPDAVSLYIDATQVKMGEEQVILMEMVPQELQVLVVNMTQGAEIPNEITPAFYGCMHALSSEVVGCISQFVVPTFDECVALSSERTESFDLSEPRAMPTCGLSNIENGEFALCSDDHPVIISIWNLEDKFRTVELTYSFDACEACNEIEGTCYYGYYYQALFWTYSIALLVCCCCVGCVCGCATTPDDEEEEDYDEEQN